jgi:hypothetical protein
MKITIAAHICCSMRHMSSILKLDKQLALKSLKLESRKKQKQHGKFLFTVSKRRD